MTNEQLKLLIGVGTWCAANICFSMRAIKPRKEIMDMRQEWLEEADKCRE